MAIAGSVANISSSFVIKSTFTAGQGTYSITVGRSLRVIQMYGTGVSGSVITARKNTDAGVTVATCSVLNAAGGGSDNLVDQPSVMSTTAADLSLASTDVLHVTVATQDATSITLLCSATGGGQALTTANLT